VYSWVLCGLLLGRRASQTSPHAQPALNGAQHRHSDEHRERERRQGVELAPAVQQQPADGLVLLKVREARKVARGRRATQLLPAHRVVNDRLVVGIVDRERDGRRVSFRVPIEREQAVVELEERALDLGGVASEQIHGELHHVEAQLSRNRVRDARRRELQQREANVATTHERQLGVVDVAREEHQALDAALSYRVEESLS